MNVDNNKILVMNRRYYANYLFRRYTNRYWPDHRSTILLTGYQAGGTRGARLLNGEREIKIHGQFIPVHAQVKSMTNTSAHADYQEMLNWLKHFKKPPKKLFITHGDLNSTESFKEKVEKEFGWQCVIPSYMQTENLD